MKATFSTPRFLGAAILLAPCLALLLSGCDLESYPTDLKYPLRTDPIVAKAVGDHWETTRPGEQDKEIARLNTTGGQTLDPQTISAKERQELDAALNALFGTPSQPKVNAADSEAKEQATALHLDENTLAAGSVLYRRHCMHCHGVTGDGRGPTGPWINPHPRDYRQGVFKFISTATTVDKRKPRRDDIHRTLERGIEGTSMPSFSLLEEAYKEQLVSYVMHLSLRGEVELTTMKTILNKEAMEGSIRENAEGLLAVYLKNWSDSDGKVLEPTPYPFKNSFKKDDKEWMDSIRRGYDLFSDMKGTASCIACHVDFGRQAPFRYDDWGTLVRPANLTAGVYRGGRRPIDLYWRIRGGIPPSGMPRAELKDEEYWDLVNFVQALPYPGMLPDYVRDRIYARHEKTPAARAQR